MRRRLRKPILGNQGGRPRPAEGAAGRGEEEEKALQEEAENWPSYFDGILGCISPAGQVQAPWQATETPTAKDFKFGVFSSVFFPSFFFFHFFSFCSKDALLHQGLSALKLLKTAMVIQLICVESVSAERVDKQRVRGKAIWRPCTTRFRIRRAYEDTWGGVWVECGGLKKQRQVQPCLGIFWAVCQ